MFFDTWVGERLTFRQPVQKPSSESSDYGQLKTQKFKIQKFNSKIRFDWSIDGAAVGKRVQNFAIHYDAKMCIFWLKKLLIDPISSFSGPKLT